MEAEVLCTQQTKVGSWTWRENRKGVRKACGFSRVQPLAGVRKGRRNVEQRAHGKRTEQLFA